MTQTVVTWAAKAAQRGYTIAQNIVLFDERLRASTRLLYFQLAHYAWRNPDDFPTQEEIAANLGVTDRQLRRYAAQLEERWLLERRERGLGRPVEYVLYEPDPDYLEREPRPGRPAKRGPVETSSASDISVRPGSDTSVRLGRTSASDPLLSEVREDFEEQEKNPLDVKDARPRAITRDDHQRVADAAENSLRRTRRSA